MSFVIETVMLPPPYGTGIPFDTQGTQILDPLQVHVQAPQVQIATQLLRTRNPLPFTYGRFNGPYPYQPNQPQYLTINEQVY